MARSKSCRMQSNASARSIRTLPMMFLFYLNIFFHSLINIKGRLSGQMTWQFLNAFDWFSSLKNLSNFRFHSFFIFNKREPQSFQLATNQRKALFEFWRHKQVNRWIGFYNFLFFNFLIFKLLLGSYVSF